MANCEGNVVLEPPEAVSDTWDTLDEIEQLLYILLMEKT